MPRNFGLHRAEPKSPCEVETRNIDVVLIVLGGPAGAMFILSAAAVLS